MFTYSEHLRDHLGVSGFQWCHSSVIVFFKKYLLSACCVPGTVIDKLTTPVGFEELFLCFGKFCVSLKQLLKPVLSQ